MAARVEECSRWVHWESQKMFEIDMLCMLILIRLKIRTKSVRTKIYTVWKFPKLRYMQNAYNIILLRGVKME